MLVFTFLRIGGTKPDNVPLSISWLLLLFYIYITKVSRDKGFFHINFLQDKIHQLFKFRSRTHYETPVMFFRVMKSIGNNCI